MNQGADDYLLIEYGEGNFDLNHRCRVTALIKALRDSTGEISFSNGLINTVGCGTCKFPPNLRLCNNDGAWIWKTLTIRYLIWKY